MAKSNQSAAGENQSSKSSTTPSQNSQKKQTSSFAGNPIGLWVVTGHGDVAGGRGIRHNLGNTTKCDKEGKVIERCYYQVVSWAYGDSEPKSYAVGSQVLIIAEHETRTKIEGTTDSYYVAYEQAKIIPFPHFTVGVLNSVISRWEEKQNTLADEQGDDEDDDIPF